jgi:hypothetical protein
MCTLGIVFYSKGDSKNKDKKRKNKEKKKKGEKKRNLKEFLGKKNWGKNLDKKNNIGNNHNIDQNNHIIIHYKNCNNP